jgi:hypothetical protein
MCRCKDCHWELVHGVIKNQNIQFVGKGVTLPEDDVSPYQAVAIRAMEDGIGLTSDMVSAVNRRTAK